MKLNYPIDKDLRGLGSIDDLLHIFINNNIEQVITFDTFIAHIAILFNIPTDIFIKSKSKLKITKKRFVPFCESTDQIKPLITYH